MRAGGMRRLITIQQKTVTQDGIGGESVSWTDYATVWARVEPAATARELFSSEQILSDKTSLFHVRYRTDLTYDTTMRISYRSEYYNIRGIINRNDRDREFILIAEQGVDEG